MIQGAKTKLRAIEPEDANAYFQWINDEETNQWRGLYHPTSREEALKWIEEHRKQASIAINFALLNQDHVHIGFVGMQSICARSRRAELWIYIGDKSQWSQGLGADAVQTICQYAFEQMNLHRIWLECNPEFENVVRCYEKLGFRREGNLRDAYYRNGAFRDTCIMALLKPEFRRNV